MFLSTSGTNAGVFNRGLKSNIFASPVVNYRHFRSGGFLLNLAIAKSINRLSPLFHRFYISYATFLFSFITLIPSSLIFIAAL